MFIFLKAIGLAIIYSLKSKDYNLELNIEVNSDERWGVQLSNASFVVL